jgi:hypothetical protein
MKYALVILSAILLLGAALFGSHPAQAGTLAQTGATPVVTPNQSVDSGQTGNGITGTGGTPVSPPGTPGEQGNGAPPSNSGNVNQGTGATGSTHTTNDYDPATSTAPPLVSGGVEPNEAVGFFPAVVLPLGVLGAMIGAFISIRRDGRKARRIRGQSGGH